MEREGRWVAVMAPLSALGAMAAAGAAGAGLSGKVGTMRWRRHCQILVAKTQNQSQNASSHLRRSSSLLVQCFMLAGTHEKRRILGTGKAQTAAIPGGIARICNTARAEKTLFYVPDSVKNCTGVADILHRGKHGIFQSIFQDS
jgi:hypothetical protein